MTSSPSRSTAPALRTLAIIAWGLAGAPSLSAAPPSARAGLQQAPTQPPGPPATPSVGSVREDADGDFVPDRLGDTVTVAGVVTYEGYAARGGRETRAYLEDETGGVRLVVEDAAILTPLRRWDRVRVHGVVGQYMGTTVLHVLDVLDPTPGPARPPTPITAAEVGEAMEGRLVTLKGRAALGEQLLLHDETGAARVYLRGSILGGMDVATLLTDDPVQVTGIVEQYDRGGTLDGQYRLTPRSLEDWSAIPPNPVVRYLFGGLLLAIVLLSVLTWILAQSRSGNRKLGELVRVLRASEAELRQEIILRTAAADAMVRARERQAMSERVEALGVLAGGFAHHFNNLLTVILGNVDMALRGDVDDEDARQGLEETLQAAEHAHELVKQLLAVGRREVLQAEAQELSTAVEGAAPVLDQVAGGRIRLSVEPEAASQVFVDRKHLARILVQLVANARDAMPEGGQIRIRTQDVEVTEPIPAVGSTIAPGIYGVITVADEGPGIPAEVQPRIWDPFFTTKSVSQNAGLGLSTVLGGVQQARGHVTLTSDPGKGTVFSLYFPTLDADRVRPTPRLRVVR